MRSQDVRILTPEQVTIEFRLAGIGTRAVAHVIDWLIVLGAIGLVSFAAWIIERYIGFGSAWSYIEALLLVLAFFASFGYFIAFEYFLSGKTLGKVFMQIRVIASNGRPISFYQTLGRNLLRVIDYLPVSYLAGVVSMMVDARERRIGDLVAGTMVVLDDHRWSLAPLAVSSPVPTRLDKLAPIVMLAKKSRYQVVIDGPLSDDWVARLVTFRKRQKRMSKRAAEEVAETLFAALLASQAIHVQRIAGRVSRKKRWVEGEVSAEEKVRLLAAVARSLSPKKNKR